MTKIPLNISLKVDAFRLIFRCLCVVALFILTPESFGQGTNVKFKHISIRDGLSQSTLNDILQDELGYIWFGTQDGLNRYDGYEFKIFKHDIDNPSSISSGFVNCLYTMNDGYLWIGTNAGINIYEHATEEFLSLESEYPSLLELADKHVISILSTSDSTYWLGTKNIVYRIDSSNNLSSLTLPVPEETAIEITCLMNYNDNEIWIGTLNEGIFIYDIPSGKISRIQKKKNALNSNRINDLYLNRKDQVLIGTDFGLNVYDRKENEFTSYTYSVENPFSISSNFISRICEDHLGNIWLGTNQGGLNKWLINRNIFYSYKKDLNIESSIISDDVRSIYQDESGVMWVGTAVGLSKFDLLKQNFNHFQFNEGSISSLSRNIIWSIYTEGDIIWIGSNEGLNRYDRKHKTNRSFTPSIVVNGEKRANAIYCLLKEDNNQFLVGTDGGVYKFYGSSGQFQKANLSGIRINERTYDLERDRDDRLWISTRNGLHFFDGNEYKIFNTSNGLPGNIVRKVFQDSNGTIWIATDNGLCKLIEGQGKFEFKVYQYQQENKYSLRNNTILTIAEDFKEFIWIGTFGGGLNRLDPRTDQILSYTEKDGLPNNVIYGILVDQKDNLWCSTNNGLTKINAATRSIRNFDEYDGLQSNEFNLGAYYLDESGEMFFGGIKGVNSFFPNNIQINNLPPKIVITDFQLYNRSVPVGEGVLDKSISMTRNLVLPYDQNVISFSFSALHYSLPERNRYAYKLEGFDENWVFEDDNRRAKYTNLDPGNYTFLVKGTNSDGIWSDELELKILIDPPFWMIWWIQALALLTLLSGAFLFYRSRLKTIQQQKDKLEKEVELRTIEVRDQKEEIEKQKLLVEEEKEKLETLLLNVLPESTVEELKVKGKATARNYRQVTVMFTDFKGFTRISETLTPTELVSKLDSFFVKFDEVIEKYNVEKIKTIGDAYMCAGGIPIRNKSNPIDVTLAALEIQRVMNDFRKTSEEAGEKPWELRLGIHTGVIIAGVIGIKRFAYDIWGDTVNVASRVETNGEVGKVNASEVTYDEVKDYFECEYRGKIHAKNKGNIDMYFINKIKPHLSVDGKGIEPNDTFWEYVNLNLFSPIEFHKAEDDVLKKLEEGLPKNLHYHNVNHTREVCDAVERIALSEGIHNEDLYILKMAALYHDAGFIERYQNNEEIGATLARKELPKYGFNEEQIKLVEKLIMVTFTSKEPETLLEKILRDADLDYLGREDFHEVSARLKQELLDREMVRSDDHWDELQIDFLEKHNYFTETARKTRDELKKQHLEEIRERKKKSQKKKVIN